MALLKCHSESVIKEQRINFQLKFSWFNFQFSWRSTGFLVIQKNIFNILMRITYSTRILGLNPSQREKLFNKYIDFKNLKGLFTKKRLADPGKAGSAQLG